MSYLEDEADSVKALGESPVSSLANALEGRAVEDRSLEAVDME
jgi:hypothetical protein